MRKPYSLFTTSLLTLGTLGLGACSDDPPPSPTSVRSRITSDLGNVLHESAAASKGASSMIPTGTFSVLERALGGSGGSATSNFLHHADTAMGEAFDADAIIAELNTTLFTDANEVEDGIYAVPADVACKQTDIDQNGNPITTIDPDCAASWNKLALRIRVSENGSALKFAVQLGAAHDEPLEVALTHNSLAVSVDLDEAEAATIAIATAFGEMAPNADLSGKVTGKLTILGTAHAAVAFDIDRAVDIKVADDGVALTSPQAFRMTSAAAHVIDVELDGTAGTGAVELGLGATTFHAPGTDTFDLDLPGATAAFALAANQPLMITNISLGNRTTTLSKNGAVGIAIDLNKNGGRKLDAAIAFDDVAGTETLSVAPHFDVEIATNHAVLGDSANVYDVTRVRLDGSLRGGDGSNQLEVLTGSFAISTNPAQYGFSAAAGQCVSSDEQIDAATGDFYTAWTAGACL